MPDHLPGSTPPRFKPSPGPECPVEHVSTLCTQHKNESHIAATLVLWYHQESNRGHKDFQSFALPTELWHHRNNPTGNPFRIIVVQR